MHYVMYCFILLTEYGYTLITEETLLARHAHETISKRYPFSGRYISKTVFLLAVILSC